MARKSRKYKNIDRNIDRYKDKNIDKDIVKSDTVYNTAIYIRLSNEEKGKHQSIDTQLLYLKEYLYNQKDLVLNGVYVDNGFSGTNFNRPQWKQLMEDIKEGRIRCILVKDLSRIGRNYMETGYYLENVFVNRGVRVISVNDQYDNIHKNNSESNMNVSIQNLMNDIYAKDISKKVSYSIEKKQRLGHYLGGYPPYGYLWSTEGRHKLSIDKKVKEHVIEIFCRICEGYSDRDIANMFNERKLLSPSRYRSESGLIMKENKNTKGLWYPSTIKRISENPVYMGKMAENKSRTRLYAKEGYRVTNPEEWVIVSNTHEPIISEELYEKVQSIRKERYENKEKMRANYKRANHNKVNDKKLNDKTGYHRNDTIEYKECVQKLHDIDKDIIKNNEPLLGRLNQNQSKLLEENVHRNGSEYGSQSERIALLYDKYLNNRNMEVLDGKSYKK